jgi:hypothetical protein
MYSWQTKATQVCLPVLVYCTFPFFITSPARPKDQDLFTRPKSLCTINTTDVRPTFQRVLDIVVSEGFKSDGINWSDGEFSAWRRDGDSQAQDKIIVWLERDFEQPQSRVHVYILYARYEQFLGITGLTRVQVDPDFETGRVGLLKQKVISFATNGGGQ